MQVIANKEGISFNELVKDHRFNCTIELDDEFESIFRAYYGDRGLYNGDLRAIITMAVFKDLREAKDES